MQQSGPSTNLLCCTCSNWQRDDAAILRLGLNFSVGKCRAGRFTSHGLTRGHDHCEQHSSQLNNNIKLRLKNNERLTNIRLLARRKGAL
jgi:hypothetical protein